METVKVGKVPAFEAPVKDVYVNDKGAAYITLGTTGGDLRVFAPKALVAEAMPRVGDDVRVRIDFSTVQGERGSSLRATVAELAILVPAK